MDRAIIFDVDGTLSETEETHRRAFNAAFAEAGLPWHWDQALYHKLLAVTGGKERIRFFIESFAAPAIPEVDLDEYIPALHAQKTVAYTNMVSGGEIELRPGIRELIEGALAKGFRLAIATTTTPANIDAQHEVNRFHNKRLAGVGRSMDNVEPRTKGDNRRLLSIAMKAQSTYLKTVDHGVLSGRVSES